MKNDITIGDIYNPHILKLIQENTVRIMAPAGAVQDSNPYKISNPDLSFKLSDGTWLRIPNGVKITISDY